MVHRADKSTCMYVLYRLLHAFDGSGPNLAHIFFIPRKQILTWFHFEKPAPGHNGGSGARLRQNHAFPTNLDQTCTCFFHPPETNTRVFHIGKPKPAAKMGERGDRIDAK